MIVAGHTRLKAAQKLKLKTIPCIIANDLTNEQIKAFRLADNKTSEFSEWDFELLDEEFSDILNIDMKEFGFCMDFIGEEHLKEQNDIALDDYKSNKKQVECPACGFCFEVI